MSKAARLLKLMDLMRGRRRAVTAASLAERLSVSVRTVYRDIQALIEFGATIDGDAGVGYVLRSGVFLPPLMFSEDEIEALVLGARWVQEQGDSGLAAAANSALAKIAASASRDLDKLAEIGLWAPRPKNDGEPSPLLGVIRTAIRQDRKLRIDYIDARSVETERVLWPIALGYFEGTRVVAAWCELREDFRHFRVDRMYNLRCLSQAYPRPRRELVRLWKTHKMRLSRTPVEPADRICQ